MLDNQYFASVDSGEFTFGPFNSREACFKAFVVEHKDDKVLPLKVYIGRSIPYKPEIDVDLVIQELRSQTFNNSYNTAFLKDITDEQRLELDKKMNEILANWLEKYEYNSGFDIIEDIEECSIFEQDYLAEDRCLKNIDILEQEVVELFKANIII